MPPSTVFATLQDALPACTGPDGEIRAVPFLAACRLVLPVLESLGTAFTPARVDVSGNIERLAARVTLLGGESESVLLFDIVRAEVAEGTAHAPASCTKGLLWLKRFLEFTLRLLERLAREPALELGEAASAAYAATLRPFHGYVTTTLFSLLIHAAPYRATFERALARRGAEPEAETQPEVLAIEMAAFVAAFAPLLARIHLFLSDMGQDDPTCV